MQTYRSLGQRSLQLLMCSGLVLMAACGKKEPEADQAKGPPAMPVNFVTVETKPVVLFDELPGRVDAIKSAEIRARVDGIVEEINFSQGSDVKEGQLLFTIDPDTYQAQRNQMAAQLQNAQADARAAASLAKRYTTLIKENAVSRQEYENAIAQSEQAKAGVAAAKANLESSEINLGYTKVKAPISGRIGRAEVTEGALVSGTSGTHLATIQQLDKVYIDITRPASELMALRQAIADGSLKQGENGPTVRVFFDNGYEYEQEGRLLFSGVAVDPSTGQISLRAEIDNPDELLLPGMFVRARVERGTSDNAIVVPAQAVQFSNSGERSVMIIDEDNKVQPVKVVTGSTLGGEIQIVEGLKGGEKLIVTGFQKIGPGSPVTPVPWSDAERAEKASEQEQAAEYGAHNEEASASDTDTSTNVSAGEPKADAGDAENTTPAAESTHE